MIPGRTDIENPQLGIVADAAGRILKVFVEAGQAVTLEQPLLIMEAMKMEYTLASPRNGLVVMRSRARTRACREMSRS